MDISASFWYNLDDNALQKSLVRGATGMLIIRPNNAADKVEFVVPAKVARQELRGAGQPGSPVRRAVRRRGDLIQQDIASGTV